MIRINNDRLEKDDFQNDSYLLLLGDATKKLKEISSESISCSVTSPPYWGLRSYSVDDENEIGTEKCLDDYIDNLVSVFKEVKRTLKKDGVLWLVIGDAYTSGNRGYRANDKKSKVRKMHSRPDNPKGLKNKDLIGLPWKVAFALQADGWYLRTDIIWSKPNPIPESVKDRPHRSHEHIFLLSKSEHYSMNLEVLNDPKVGVGGFRKTVWNVAVGRRKSNHPATFPLELILPCILSSSNENDWVLDPFSGSGSVGIACLENERKYVGVELVKEFVDLADTSLSAISSANI